MRSGASLRGGPALSFAAKQAWGGGTAFPFTSVNTYWTDGELCGQAQRRTM